MLSGALVVMTAVLGWVAAEIRLLHKSLTQYVLKADCMGNMLAHAARIEKVEGKKRIMRIDGKPKYIWSTATSFEPGNTYRLTVRFSSNVESMTFPYSSRPGGDVDAPAADVTFKINGKTTTIDLYTSGDDISEWDDGNNTREMLVQASVKGTITIYAKCWCRLRLRFRR